MVHKEADLKDGISLFLRIYRELNMHVYIRESV